MSEKTLWRKCGNLIKNDDSTLTRCDSSPCGYYAIFGIKYRYLNKNLQPMQCSWYTDAFPFHVTERKILWYVYDACLQVQQKKGLCGTKKGKYNCEFFCDAWDENGNCIDEYEECTFLEIEVYNISGCFDDYNKFAEFFYANCEITTDADGKYPQIFGTYTRGMSEYGYTCIQGFWRDYFTENYTLSYKLTRYLMRSQWSMLLGYSQPVYEYQYICYNDNDYFQTTASEDCPNGYTKQTIKQDTGRRKSQGVLLSGDNNFQRYFRGTAIYDEITVTCCTDKQSVSAIPEANNFIRQQVSDKATYSQYRTESYTCQFSDNECQTIQYISQPSGNTYGSMFSYNFRFLWQKLKLQKTANTPSQAVGVKFSVTLTHTRENTGLGNEQVITETQNFDLDLFFDEQYNDLPLATNVNLVNVLKKPDCDSNCNYQDDDTWEIQPYTTWGWGNPQPEYKQNVWHEKYNFYLDAKEYIKGE